MDITTQQNIRNIFPMPLMDETFIHLGHLLILPAKKELKLTISF
jgi:hypothetical protein